MNCTPMLDANSRVKRVNQSRPITRKNLSPISRALGSMYSWSASVIIMFSIVRSDVTPRSSPNSLASIGFSIVSFIAFHAIPNASKSLPFSTAPPSSVIEDTVAGGSSVTHWNNWPQLFAARSLGPRGLRV